MTGPDRPVRARTRAGRLAALDAWVLEYEAPRWSESATRRALDIGFGETPVTTVEWASALQCLGAWHITGVERDAARAAEAQRWALESVRFCEGGFDGLVALGPFEVARALNVLRAYPEAEVPAAYSAMTAALAPGGLLLEGSTDTEGHIAVVRLTRRGPEGMRDEGLLFFTDGTQGFAPIMFRDWLPRDLRRQVKPGTAVAQFFELWSTEVQLARSQGPAETVFARSARSLAVAAPQYALETGWAERGYLRVGVSLRGPA